MVIRWSSNGHPMVIRWSSNGHRVVIRWSSDGHRLVTQWPVLRSPNFAHRAARGHLGEGGLCGPSREARCAVILCYLRAPRDGGLRQQTTPGHGAKKNSSLTANVAASIPQRRFITESSVGAHSSSIALPTSLRTVGGDAATETHRTRNPGTAPVGTGAELLESRVLPIARVDIHGDPARFPEAVLRGRPPFPHGGAGPAPPRERGWGGVVDSNKRVIRLGHRSNRVGEEEREREGESE